MADQLHYKSQKVSLVECREDHQNNEFWLLNSKIVNCDDQNRKVLMGKYRTDGFVGFIADGMKLAKTVVPLATDPKGSVCVTIKQLKDAGTIEIDQKTFELLNYKKV